MSPRSKDVRLTDAELAVFARGYAHHPGMMALLGHIRVLDADRDNWKAHYDAIATAYECRVDELREKDAEIAALKAELELAKKSHPSSGHERTYALEDGGI